MLDLQTNLRLRSRANIISFGKDKDYQSKLPKLEHPVPQKLNPVNVPLAYSLVSTLYKFCNKTGQNPNEYILTYIPHLAAMPGVVAESSVTANIGRSKVTTLIDAEQIFGKTLDYIKSAEKSIQIEMFEFQNKDVDGNDWPSNGAEAVPGWEYQNKLLNALIDKKLKNKNLKIQVILDVHKWYIDGNGSKERDYSFVDQRLIDAGLVKDRDKYRKYANMAMIKKLKENGIDVVPYPRQNQQGSVLQHVKMLAVDSKKAIIGGMNWGNHSAANHDVCVSVEPREYKTGHEYQSTEVANIIDQIFNKDWKFAWQRLGHTKFVPGPQNIEEQEDYSGIKMAIKAEDIEYNQIIGEIFNKPEYLNRYDENRLDMIEVQPIEDPAISVYTNKPRELSIVDEEGSEIVGLIKEKIKTANSFKAELFVFSHKEITKMVIDRWQEAQSGGRHFDVQILVSPDIMQDFPYCQKAYLSLLKAGVPIRGYNTNKSINQRLHCKLAVFDNKDVIIGSANWSAVGLEQNLEKGKRDDYPLTDDAIDKIIINEHKETIQNFEKQFGIASIFDSEDGDLFDYENLKNRIAYYDKEFQRVEEKNSQKFVIAEGKAIKTDEKTLISIKRLVKEYKAVKRLENSKPHYQRGNNECVIVFSSPKIASTFIRQFEKDWKYSEIKQPQPAFTGSRDYLRDLITSKEPKFDRII